MRTVASKEEKIMDFELARRDEVESLIRDIIGRSSLSWKQKMVLVQSLTVLELNEISNNEEKKK